MTAVCLCDVTLSKAMDILSRDLVHQVPKNRQEHAVFPGRITLPPRLSVDTPSLLTVHIFCSALSNIKLLADKDVSDRLQTTQSYRLL